MYPLPLGNGSINESQQGPKRERRRSTIRWMPLSRGLGNGIALEGRSLSSPARATAITEAI